MTAHPAAQTLREAGALGTSERREVLRHVARCATCRAIYTISDPTKIFGLLAERPLPAELLEQVSSGVAAAINRAPAAAGRTAHLRAAVALAASLILGVATLWWTGGDPNRARAVPAVADLHEIMPLASVALLDSPREARVVDLTMGETQLVMIFDRELDL